MINSLRLLRNEEVRRATAITIAVGQLRAAQTRLPRAMHENLLLHVDQEPVTLDVPPIDAVVPVIGDAFLHAVIDEHYIASNIVYAMREIEKLAKHRHPLITITAEPDVTTWGAEEVQMVQRTYRRQIMALMHRLRDINTHWKDLSRYECRLPGFVKSSLMEMFGKPDHLPGLEYSEIDFKQQRHGLKVLSRRWLAPFLGIEQATMIEQQMAIIGEQSAPRAGEPPTLDYFSSHTSNKIAPWADEEEPWPSS